MMNTLSFSITLKLFMNELVIKIVLNIYFLKILKMHITFVMEDMYKSSSPKPTKCEIIIQLFNKTGEETPKG